MLDNKLKLAIELVQIRRNLSDENIIKKVKEEFNLTCTQNDLNIMKASNWADNFDVESRKIQYYG